MNVNRLSKGARRFQHALAEHGIEAVVEELPESTKSASDAANAIQCEQGQIVKSLLFVGSESGKPILILTSGINTVATEKIRSLIGEGVRQADASYVKAVTGYAIGGVPPVCHTTQIKTLIDRDLVGITPLWIAAGAPSAVVKIVCTITKFVPHGVVAEVRQDT